MELLDWFRRQARSHQMMISGARELGILDPSREREELEILMAEAYRRGFDEGAMQHKTIAGER